MVSLSLCDDWRQISRKIGLPALHRYDFRYDSMTSAHQQSIDAFRGTLCTRRLMVSPDAKAQLDTAQVRSGCWYLSNTRLRRLDLRDIDRRPRLA